MPIMVLDGLLYSLYVYLYIIQRIMCQYVQEKINRK